MRRARPVATAVVSAALLAVLVTAAAIAGGSPSARGRARPRARESSQTSPVDRLTLPELAGQRIVYAYSGLQPPSSLLQAIRAGEAGGVIFFADNIATPAQLRAVAGELQRASLASPVHAPLLTLVDQEGGEIRRLPGAPALSERQIGASGDGIARARSAGTGAGSDLRDAGIDVNLAPVLDVFRRPGDFIDQFGRSYSSNPARVAALGAAFITAQERLRVAATAKHFPGLGAAARTEDTDARPVILRLPLRTLRSVDEAPYRLAIARGVRLVMTSWATYPALDGRRPAGLSPRVIQGELRQRLGFRGVTITDGIDAGAVTPFGDLARRAVLAASAGADLILCAARSPTQDTPTQGLVARRALLGALADHELTLGAARQSAQRILELRASLAPALAQ